MKVTKLSQGIYKIVDAQGTWIAKGGNQTVSGDWTAYDCEDKFDCSDENNWGVGFKTFKELKNYSQSF